MREPRRLGSINPNSPEETPRCKAKVIRVGEIVPHGNKLIPKDWTFGRCPDMDHGAIPYETTEEGVDLHYGYTIEELKAIAEQNNK